MTSPRTLEEIDKQYTATYEAYALMCLEIHRLQVHKERIYSSLTSLEHEKKEAKKKIYSEEPPPRLIDAWAYEEK